MRFSENELKPRNGHTLVVYVVARISGCQKQKEVSLEDQVDHAKEVVAEMYEGPVEYRVVATKGKGERLDRPELAEIEGTLRNSEADIMVQEDVGRPVRGADAVRLWGVAVDHRTRCIAPNDCCDTNDETWEQDVLNACAEHVGIQRPYFEADQAQENEPLQEVSAARPRARPTATSSRKVPRRLTIGRRTMRRLPSSGRHIFA